jgi:hypothetical protein
MMFKTFAWSALIASSALILGCREEMPFKPADLSVNMGDGGMMMNDMTMKVYKAGTINEIDTNPITGGAFGQGTAVKLTGVVIVSPSRYIEAMQSTRCDYLVQVQDPACTVPPCGLIAIVRGPTKTAAEMCPFPDDSTSVLKGSRVGDKVDIEGVVDRRSWAPLAGDGGSGGMATTEHQVDIDTYVKTGTGTVTPFAVTADTSKFQTYGVGADWQKYEGTVVKLQAMTGKLTVTKNDGAVQPFHFYTSPGNTDWGTDNRSLYRADGGADFPQPGLQFTSITGVPVMAFGGAVMPRFMNDFAP